MRGMIRATTAALFATAVIGCGDNIRPADDGDGLGGDDVDGDGMLDDDGDGGGGDGGDGGGGDGDGGVPVVCSYGQGEWKNNLAIWRVWTLSLGNVSYDRTQLTAMLDTPVSTNGLVQLSYQLIAAKLNIALGAPDVSVAASITAADALIGDLVIPPVGDGWLATAMTSSLAGTLEAFNQSGLTGAQCGTPAALCGDGTLEPGEQCDDGNQANGDGCSASCAVTACGNALVEEGEECDDGNTTAGDGCSATCACEPTAPPT